MQRKDYQTIARIINDTYITFSADSATYSIEQIESVKKFYTILIDKFCSHLRLENPTFDKDRFLKSLE